MIEPFTEAFRLALPSIVGSAVALVLSRQDHADMSCVWKIQPSYVSSTKEVLTVLANGQVVVHFDERQRLAVNMTDPDHTLDVGGDGRFSTNLIVGGTLDVTGNTTLAGERLYFTHTAPLIRLPDNKAAALTIENHDGSAGEFVCG